MYSVSLILKNSQIALMFNYKAFKSADDLYKKAKLLMRTDTVFEAEDDFEMKSCVDMSNIASVSFSEYEKEMKKNGEIQILQKKSDMNTMKLASQDFGLRALSDAADFIPGEHKLKA